MIQRLENTIRIIRTIQEQLITSSYQGHRVADINEALNFLNQFMEEARQALAKEQIKLEIEKAKSEQNAEETKQSA